MFVMSDKRGLNIRGNYFFQNLIVGDPADLYFTGVNPRGSQSTVRDGSDDADGSVPGLQFVLPVHA